MGRGAEAEQASSNARAQSVSNAGLLIAMRSRSIESKLHGLEFAALLPFGNKTASSTSEEHPEAVTAGIRFALVARRTSVWCSAWRPNFAFVNAPVDWMSHERARLDGGPSRF